MFYRNKIIKISLILFRFIFLLIITILFSCCSAKKIFDFSKTYHDGYVIDPESLEAISIGSSQEYVILSLGSPSTKSMFDDEIFYYISQNRYQKIQFLQPIILERHILAIYFDKDKTVKKISHYGLKDGNIFDLSSKTTATIGKEEFFLYDLLQGIKAVPYIIH